jgi:hypothetical protein
MTVNTPISTASYTGNGVTQTFPIPFYFLVATDVKVSRKLVSTGVTTVLTLNSDYSLAGAGNESGGTLTTVAVPASGDQLYIERNVDAVQQTEYPENNRFPSASHEKALDRLTMLAQQILSRITFGLYRDPLGATYDLGNNRLINSGAAVAGTDVPNLQQVLASVVAGAAPALVGPSGSALVGFIAAAAGSVTRTVQDKIREWVSVKDFGAHGGATNDTAAFQAAATAGGVVHVPDGKYTVGAVTAGAAPTYWVGNFTDNTSNLPLNLPGIQDGFYSGSKWIYQPQAGASDVTMMQIRRDVNYTGGSVGFLNSALRIQSNVNSSANPYECGMFVIQDNHASGAQHFAMGSQANKFGTGPSWSLVTEVHEKTATADPINATIGYELDVCANGTDVFFQRFGLAIIAKKENPSGAQCVVGTGISLAGGSPGEALYGIGLQFGRAIVATTFNDAIDMSTATINGAGIRMATDQCIAFDVGATRTIRYNVGAGGIRMQLPGGHVFDFKDGGDFNLTGNILSLGTQVLTSRRTGWGTPTGTTSRATFDTGSVTTAQLAQAVKGLIEDLKTHGLIGP